MYSKDNARELGKRSVLFVCHGNICRSPMAEFVMKDMLDKRGLSQEVHVESAATRTDELGHPMHAGTAEVLTAHGIPFAPREVRQVRPHDYYDFDVIVGMDEANMRDLHHIFNGDPHNKLHKMMEFAGSRRDVADPWFTGDFQKTHDDISDACTGLLAWLHL